MHELIGENSPLWLIHPRIALALWVSLPSGDSKVTILRSALAGVAGVPCVSFAMSPALHVLLLKNFSNQIQKRLKINIHHYTS